MKRLPLVPRCKACGSGIVVGRILAIEKYQTSHWYECQNCGYSTPGRTTWEMADYDINWENTETEELCNALGEPIKENE